MPTVTTSPFRSKLGLVFLGILFVIAVVFVANEIKYFGFEESVLGRYYAIKWWLVRHLAGGILALLIGPFQFWDRFRLRYLKWHRRLGAVYLGGIVVASFSSIYMAWTTAVAVNVTWALSLQVLCFAWLTTAFMAYRAIRKRRIQQHKEWMIRSYIVTFVFVAFRFINDGMEAMGVSHFVERAPSIIYITLFIPLLIAETIFQWNKK